MICVLQISSVLFSESPKTVQMTAPDQTEAGSELIYECASPLSSPQQSIRWEVTDWQGEVLQFDTGQFFLV